jgi:hypothetical protein
MIKVKGITTWVWPKIWVSSIKKGENVQKNYAKYEMIECKKKGLTKGHSP